MHSGSGSNEANENQCWVPFVPIFIWSRWDVECVQRKTVMSILRHGGVPQWIEWITVLPLWAVQNHLPSRCIHRLGDDLLKRWWWSRRGDCRITQHTGPKTMPFRSHKRLSISPHRWVQVVLHRNLWPVQWFPAQFHDSHWLVSVIARDLLYILTSF